MEDNLFCNEITSLIRVMSEKARCISFPKSSKTFVFFDSFETISDSLIKGINFFLSEKFACSLKPGPDHLYRIEKGKYESAGDTR